jgi:hypothetical protein
MPKASNSTTPSVSIGLSPPDCPLNVTVGSLVQSGNPNLTEFNPNLSQRQHETVTLVGLLTDRHLLVAGRWFKGPASVPQITAGSTVGMLVNIKSPAELPTALRAATDSCNKDSSGVVKAIHYIVNAVSPRVEFVAHKIDDSDDDIVLEGKGSDDGSHSPVVVQFNINGVPLHFPPEAMDSFNDSGIPNAPLYPSGNSHSLCYVTDCSLYCLFFL